MTTETNTAKDKTPTHIIYVEQEYNGQKKRLRVGAAWKHSKGEGFAIKLDKLVAFPNTPKEPQTN